MPDVQRRANAARSDGRNDMVSVPQLRLGMGGQTAAGKQTVRTGLVIAMPNEVARNKDRLMDAIDAILNRMPDSTAASIAEEIGLSQWGSASFIDRKYREERATSKQALRKYLHMLVWQASTPY